MQKQRTKTKRRRLIVPKRLTVLLITVILLTIPIVLYFTTYISSRTSYLTNRDFRQLASISKQLEDRIVELKKLFIRAIDQAALDQSLGDEHLKDNFQQHLGKSLQAINAVIPKGSEKRTLEEIFKDPGSESSVSMQLITGGETSTLYFVWKDESGSFKASAKLDEIIKPFIALANLESRKGSEHQEGFDAVLIASLENKNTNGKPESAETSRHSKVIFQQGSSDLDVDSLDNLVRAQVPDKTIDLGALTENSTFADVELAGTTYKIYSQPIEIPLRITSSETANASKDNAKASGRAETNWVVCGLVQSSHFRREAWAFPYTALIGVVFVVVIVALSWPFVKLHFIGPKDRLRLADFYWIGFSMVVGSAILTFFMLFAVSYLRSEDVLDHSLEAFAAEIDDRFHKEIDCVLEELSTLQDRGRADLKENRTNQFVQIKPDEPKLSHRRNNLGKTDIEEYPGVTRTSILINGVKSDEPYPYFRMGVWMNEKGAQRLEWTTSSTPSQGGSPDRDYFKRIIEGNSRGNSSQGRYWLEPITSRLTYEKAVVVSAPSDDKTAPADKGGIMIAPEMLSLMHTVVPQGFGFRVIDNSGNDPSDDNWDEPGKVLFQSSESQQLKENFFEECDNNHALRSLVFGRAAGFVTLDYKGESHRLYISPIKGFPNWSLVVFRNKQPLRTVYLEILTVAGSIFLSYSIFLLLPITVYYIFRIRKDERTQWIWPTALMAGAYRQTFRVSLLLCVLSLAVMLGGLKFLYINPDGWMPLVFVSVIASAGILGLALKYWRSWPTNSSPAVNLLKTKTLIDHKVTYICNVVTLLILVGILPAITFFRFAYNEEMKLFVKHGQVVLGRGLAEREKRVRAEYAVERADRKSNPSPFGTKKSEEAKVFIEQRLNYWRDDIYTKVFFETLNGQKVQNKGINTPDDDSPLVSLVKTVSLPLFNEMSLEMGGVLQGQATDKLWGWTKSDDNKLTFYSSLPGVEKVQTQLERFNSDWQWARLWMAVGFAAITLILLLLARFVVRRIFLLDITEDSFLPVHANGQATQNTFLVHASPFAKVNGNFASCHYIDLVTEASQNDWVKKLEAKITADQTSQTVVVDHFEFRMNDPAHNDQKLRLIKTLVGSKKPVFIKSSHLPSAFSFTGAARDAIKHDPNEASISWAEIMTQFRRVYEAEAHDEVLDHAVENLEKVLSEKAPERKDKTMKLAAQVREECTGHTWLANIGKEIIDLLATEDLEFNYLHGQIHDRAELCYHKLWNNCSRDEKLTLLHLADDRLLSHNDPDIRPLMQRGLIVCAPDLRLMNETFKRFVLSQCFLDVAESAEIRSAETQARKTSYLERFKIPVLVGFAGVVLFLLLTQKDLTSSWTLVTAATTGIPTVFKVLSFLKSDNTGQRGFFA